ncbi:TonB-dependent receptor [Methylotuvimicrobium alcaliphilum]|uniref:TonB-dependent receptor n=1 Tax=Methylotuvimicrobium alcaliphilum (strain DSM 19304 / NCIMB 14124 / VKM B-2133 / 20Z) TaxID=1091494 RepID=G4T201_META2|nr:TonB-dependent receptor [Methylotuvimicrobium alcaliphilum]CCE24675.1 putative TonB-dependent receptor [Methylotuvimicrobium alcaliphilum 20Z]
MKLPTVINWIALTLSILTSSGMLWASEADDPENGETVFESAEQDSMETTESAEPETGEFDVELEKMVIEAIAPTADSTSELSDIDLRLKSASTLGKTLERELGVYNASFGPGVGQPIIRGMGGPRVRVMHDGIGSHDASAMSQDHAVAAESLLADSITIHRGPATLRYGSGAIGGVVDVKHKRIPDSVPLKPIEGTAEYRYDHNPKENAGMVGIDAGKGNVAVHLDYFQRGNENTRIPGFALDEAALRKQLKTDVQLNNSKGEIKNTDGESRGGSAGISWIDDLGYVGTSYNHTYKAYGLPPGDPGGHSHVGVVPGASNQGEAMRFEMEQRRYDVEAMLFNPIPYIESVSVKTGYVDYEHEEGEPGFSVLFTNEVLETRFELEHRLLDQWSGFLGLQWQDREFLAENLVPQSQIDSLGLFFTEKLDVLDELTLEFGGRYERQVTEPNEKMLNRNLFGQPVQVPTRRLTHNPSSLAASITYKPFDGGSIYLAWQNSERAPDIQEMYSLGPHPANRSFDIGRLDLAVERASNREIGIRYDDALISLQGNAYQKDVKDFIYQENLGLFYQLDTNTLKASCSDGLRGCFPIYGFRGDDAEFYGYEAEIKFHPSFDWGTPHLTLFSDYVRGRFRDRALGDVPRLPPQRYGFEVGLQKNAFQGALRFTQALAQDRPGNDETVTPSYHRFDIDVSYDWHADSGQRVLLFGKASNLSDSPIRNSTSFLRNIAPEPGMSLEIGFRAYF